MSPTPSSWPLCTRLRTAAWVVLAVGLAAASLIYALAAPDADADVDLGDSRIDDYNIERIGGKAAVYVVHFDRWLGSLWHGRPLAVTVAVLTLLAAGLCLWLAAVAAEPPHAGGENGPAR
jgi:hypothetical protein